jgi:shikimate kinase
MNEDAQKKIILIGYRCTGKTSIGKRLAASLEIPFIDTDELIELAAGQSIISIIDEKGWNHFRHREKQAIKTLTSYGKGVIATGGGAVMDNENAAILKGCGWLVWLIADEQTILKRMVSDRYSAHRRPPLTNSHLRKEIAETLSQRVPLYRLLADISVDTSLLSIEESVKKIMEALKERQTEEYQ